jgi:hypothetical protein
MMAEAQSAEAFLAWWDTCSITSGPQLARLSLVCCPAAGADRNG